MINLRVSELEIQFQEYLMAFPEMTEKVAFYDKTSLTIVLAESIEFISKYWHRRAEAGNIRIHCFLTRGDASSAQ